MIEKYGCEFDYKVKKRDILAEKILLMKRALRITAITLLLINGIGAIWGGFGLIYDPSGNFMQMPLEFLQYSPFSNYLIPGIILLVFNGFLSLAAATLVARKHRFHSHFTIFQGVVLVIWLSVQIVMIRQFYFPLHLPFYIIGFGLIFIGIFLINRKNQLIKSDA